MKKLIQILRDIIKTEIFSTIYSKSHKENKNYR